MASYHNSFSYMGENSRDKGLIVVAFDADNGLTDTYLGMDQVYTDNYDGTKRVVYGTKYNNVTTITISVIKSNGTDFSVEEVQKVLRWLTGARKASWLDLYDGNTIQCSFLCTNDDVQQYKLDGRTVGFTITFLSVSPYAYSPEQCVDCTFGQSLLTTENGILYKDGEDLSVNTDGVLLNGKSASFDIANDGTIYIDNSVHLQIDNKSDDLYSYVYMDTTFVNTNSDHIIIKNQTLYDESNGEDGLTEITGMFKNEVIKLSSGQFITSDVTTKIFGNDFNFIWPKLMPGINNIFVSGSGEGFVEFKYRYPIKIGNFAMNISVSGAEISCGDYYDNNTGGNDMDSNTGGNTTGGVISGTLAWENITNKPTTRDGYNIKDVYTKTEVDKEIDNAELSIDEDELNAMLSKVLGE